MSEEKQVYIARLKNGMVVIGERDDSQSYLSNCMMIVKFNVDGGRVAFQYEDIFFDSAEKRASIPFDEILCYEKAKVVQAEAYRNSVSKVRKMSAIPNLSLKK